MAGKVGHNAVPLPSVVVVIISTVLLLSAIYASKEMRRVISMQNSWLLAIAGAISTLAVFAILYVSHTDVGASEVAGLQGRYFLPLILFFIPLLTRIFDISLVATKRQMAGLITLGFISSIFSLLVYYLHLTYYSI